MHHPSVSHEHFNARSIHEDTECEAPCRGVDGRLAFPARWVNGGSPVDVREGAAEECPGGDVPPSSGCTAELEANVGGRAGRVPSQFTVQVICQRTDIEVLGARDSDVTKAVALLNV